MAPSGTTPPSISRRTPRGRRGCRGGGAGSRPLPRACRHSGSTRISMSGTEAAVEVGQRGLRPKPRILPSWNQLAGHTSSPCGCVGDPDKRAFVTARRVTIDRCGQKAPDRDRRSRTGRSGTPVGSRIGRSIVPTSGEDAFALNAGTSGHAPSDGILPPPPVEDGEAPPACRCIPGQVFSVGGPGAEHRGAGAERSCSPSRGGGRGPRAEWTASIPWAAGSPSRP
jgi:hypothetical protein